MADADKEKKSAGKDATGGGESQRPSSGYDRLVALARNKSAQSRRELVEAVGDLVFERDAVLSERERALITVVLERLIHEVEVPVRKALAERLSNAAHAPHDLILALANDEIEVAQSVLTHSVVLRELDLIEVVRHRTMEHQLAVAVRKHGLTESIAAALVEQGHVDVMKALLENKDAQISRATMEYLVEQAKRKDTLQNPILQRHDLDPGLAKKLYWWVSAALRRHILDRFQVDPSELDDQLEATVLDLVDEAKANGTPASKAEALAHQLKASGALDAKLLVQVLRQGEVPLFEAMFAELADLRLTLVRRLIYESGGEGLAIACRALGVEKPVFASIFLLSRRARPGDQTVDPMELSRALAFFDGLEKDAAERMLKRWRRDPQFLEAVWRVDSGKPPPEK